MVGRPLLVAIPLWMTFGQAALTEPETCYVLDAILLVYGIVLTALYCRLKIRTSKESAEKKANNKQMTEEGIYTDLTSHAQDTYSKIGSK
ncbi:high affinity immunoglobulin epsilon receptor subunit gamma isoform X2 [Corythoichthys intestinalis]|uniref:high affinity immunoglobulin epsilon receptor subunit gamma isoform X2 n=1 Tax=Corythoichthys intestinalis TaxID=161448 RepID=UPI0025A556C8|nr:high affinity immunoglobulin epsilon receptor subunit gamma isoform X2 [Corythoichthys intestinalis]